jgi:exonuclease III
VDVVCLQETKMTEISRGTILFELGSDFSHFAQLPSVGTSGGILLAWKHNLGPAATVRIDNHCITVQINPSDGHAWWFTGVYGPQGDDNKMLFLQELRDV